MANGMNIRHRRRKNIPVGLLALTAFLIVLSVLLGASVFFKVSQIVVEGNSKYTDEIVSEASGIKQGTRVYAVKPEQAELNISKKLSFVDTVEVSLLYPNQIKITVTESCPIAAVFHSGDWWILDKNCRILEYGTNNEAHTYIVITGLEAVKGELGTTIEVSEENEIRLSRASEILKAIFDAHLETSITAMDITDVGNILLTYGEKITVKLGSGQDAADKLMLLSEISDKLDVSREGTVQLGENGQAYYTKH